MITHEFRAIRVLIVTDDEAVAASVREMLLEFGEGRYEIATVDVETLLASPEPDADVLLVAIGPDAGRIEAIRGLLASGARPPLVALVSHGELAKAHQYRILFDANPQPMWVYDRETLQFLAVNDAAVHHYGYSRDEFLAMTIADIRPPEDVPALREAVALGGELRHRGLWRHLRKDGSVLVAEISSHTLAFDGHVAVLVLSVDVTEKVRVLDALRESEERYREMFEADVIGNFISTPDGRILACNEKFAKILGYGSADEIKRVNAYDLYVDPARREAFVETLRGGGRVDQLEFTLRRLDGEPVYVLESVLGHIDERGELVQIKGFVVDVTEQRLLEQGLRQAQKMEAVGRLAGGIAHDFNNMLTVILGYSELALDRLRPGDPLRADVEQIRATSRRAASLTQQLLAFGRKQIMKPRVINLNRIVTEMERMLRRVIGEGIDLRTVLEPELDATKADPSLIEQIVMNLAVNARDAMSGKGVLTIETANVELDESYVRNHPGAAAGAHVMLAVSDTGVGMDDETKARIFEPFFTTKGVGEGTGLGLASVYGTVKQSGGFIWVYSEPGEGTTIQVYLPRTLARAAPSEEHERIEIARGDETVLVVEDEEAVRRLIVRTLGSAGYRVLEARDGSDALRRVAELGGRVDLLVTDVVMPSMGGRELAERLASERPGMRVLYISGYTGNSLAHGGMLEEGVAFLEKPFSPAALAAKVRAVLDGEE